jgi:hypothetical protein
LGRLPLMRSIIMNVILAIDYNRYIMSIEDAAKVMGILGKARSVSSRYDGDEGESYFQYDQRPPICAIEQITKEIRD